MQDECGGKNIEKAMDDEYQRIESRLKKADVKGNDVYQEYLISIIIKHKDTSFAHNLWFEFIPSVLKAKVFKNAKIKAVQIVKGIKRSPYMAAAEGDWLEM